MKLSNISLPHSTVIQLYYSFSTITLIFTFVIAPLVIYIILTQSKGLKNFKWFLLNHLFWSFLLETGISIFKPVILTQPISIYLLISESPFVTAVTCFIYTSAALACGMSAGMTFINRYFTIFPSPMNKFLSTTKLLSVGLIVFVVSITPLFIILLISMSNDFQTSSKNDFDIFRKELHLPSLYFIPTNYFEAFGKLIFLGIIACAILVSIGFAYFIFLVQKNLTMTVSKLQRTLFASAIIQICLFIVFLISPIFVMLIAIIFKIENFSSFNCLLFSFLSCHSLLDYIVILIVITPYRNYLIKKFRKIFCRKISSAVGISAIATSEYQSIKKRRES